MARRKFPAGSTFNHRRNTSRVFPVPPGSLEAAQRSLEQFAQDHPAHAQWIKDGYPTLTDAEHVERFGKPYKR